MHSITNVPVSKIKHSAEFVNFLVPSNMLWKVSKLQAVSSVIQLYSVSNTVNSAW